MDPLVCLELIRLKEIFIPQGAGKDLILKFYMGQPVPLQVIRTRETFVTLGAGKDLSCMDPLV